MSAPAAPPDTRSPAITEEQLQRLVHAINRSGASVNVTDPRVSAVQAWILGLVGAGIVGAAIWGGQSLQELNTTVKLAIARQNALDDIQADHESRLRHLERRP